MAPGGMPAGRDRLEGSEAMASSDTVVNAFLGMCETDYRGALRSLVTAGNPQMSEEEIRERVRLQAEYQPQETAVARLRAWVDDDSLEAGPRLRRAALDAVRGEHGRAAGFRRAGRPRELSRQLFPDAHVEEIEDGIMSRPDLTAAVVRRVTAPLRAARGLSDGQTRASRRSRAPLGGAGRGPAGRAGSLLLRDIPASTKACSRTSPAITAW